MFLGAQFCSHCGARADRAETEGATQCVCPRCKVKLGSVVIGGSSLLECSRCEGIWADAVSLHQICADRERQAAVLGMATPLPQPAAGNLESNIRYVPCPVCRSLMNRVNFAHCSNVVVDVCARHGTWFDKDELRRIVEFIRGGGIEAARSREIADLEAQRRQLKASQIAGAWDSPSGGMDRGKLSYADWELGISAAAKFLDLIFRH